MERGKKVIKDGPYLVPHFSVTASTLYSSNLIPLLAYSILLLAQKKSKSPQEEQSVLSFPEEGFSVEPISVFIDMDPKVLAWVNPLHSMFDIQDRGPIVRSLLVLLILSFS